MPIIIQRVISYLVSPPTIEGVELKILRVIPDDRGRLTEILRCDDPIFSVFGQVYATTVLPGVVKAWHLHKEQTDHIACIHGMVRLGLVDTREDSRTKGHTMDIYMGIHNPLLAKVPPGVLHGFKCVSMDEEAIVINVPDKPYRRDDPDEHRLPAHDSTIPFDWERKDR